MPFLLIAALVVAFFAYRYVARRHRRATLLATPLTDHQRRIIAAEVPLLDALPADLRPKLEGKVNLFLDQVTFHGCDGFEVTEAVELAIAAQACLLVVNTDLWYTTLRTVLVYPGAFQSMRRTIDNGIVTESKQIRTGESWTRGPVVLSWHDSALGAHNTVDGLNVVLHEFAHQVDALSGNTDGLPLLDRNQSFAEWERVILTSFEAHKANLKAGRRTLLDDYAVTAHEEFFARAVEVFFEAPTRFKREEPEVYDQLVTLFRLDPARW